jgi:tripartite ATP-independent transporter DctM subunit
MIPRLEEEGYPRGYATSLMTASAGLALLIPPSISMILYGWLTFTSVPACFLAGVIPGILLMSLFIIINWIMVGRYPTVRKPRPWGSIKQAAKEVGSAGWRALPALMMPVFILGSIYGGVATPTEASAVAVFLAIPLGFLVYRGLTSKRLVNALIKSGTTVGAIMVMFVFALMLGRVFVMENIPQQLTTLVMSVSENQYVLLLLVNAILFVFGMFMDDVTGMIIAAPLMLPVVRSIGITSVHFSAIITTNLTMGLMTPPMAPLVYLGQRIGRTTFTDMIKTSLLFVFAAYMPVVLLTTYLPPLAEFLPALVFGEKVLIPAY